MRAGRSVRLQIRARSPVTSPICRPEGTCGRDRSEVTMAGACAYTLLGSTRDVSAASMKRRRFVIRASRGRCRSFAPQDDGQLTVTFLLWKRRRFAAMTRPEKMSRRNALRLLAGAPLLPLIPGCATTGSHAAPASAAFIGMPAPASAADQATPSVQSAVALAYPDGTQQAYQLGYRALFYTGDLVPDGSGGTVLAGGYFDLAGKPIMDRSAGTPTQFFSDCPDGYSLLQPTAANVPGVTGNPVFAVVQFEYTTRDRRGDKMYAQLPSPIAVVTLDQDRRTGALRLVKYHNVDTSRAHGLWITC